MLTHGMPIAGRCWRCDYDLRGNERAEVCPECGSPRVVSVTIDESQFVRAVIALEDAGLLVSKRQPGGVLGSIGVITGLGIVNVPWRELDHADEVLEAAGIHTSIGALPIVDRAEPTCPRCEAELDPEGPECCAACGGPFQWVEIDQATDDVDEPVPDCPRDRESGRQALISLAGGKMLIVLVILIFSVSTRVGWVASIVLACVALSYSMFGGRGPGSDEDQRTPPP